MEDDTNSDWDNDTSSFLANERMTNANPDEVKDADTIEKKNTTLSKQATNTNMLERYVELSKALNESYKQKYEEIMINKSALFLAFSILNRVFTFYAHMVVV